MQLLTFTSINEQVQDMIPRLQSVKQGSAPCHLAEEFRIGRKAQTRLHYMMPQGGLSDDQYEHLCVLIRQLFREGSIYCDFELSVLVPEAVALLLCNTCQMTYNEALKYMGGVGWSKALKSANVFISHNCRT